jgi:outer membrane protein assembly factor BamD (BamD/ComL family)
LDKELKKQIKEDELVSVYQHAAAWWGGHRESARLTLGVVAVIVAVAGGLALYQSRRNEAAALAFADAFETMQATVTSALPAGADKPVGLSFATAEEKYKKAAAAFEGIDRRYPTLAVGRRAKYFGALARLELGDAAAAETALKELAARRDLKELEPTLARLALGDVYRRTGHLDQAIDAYRQFADDATVPFPRDYALMSLGGAQEEAKKPAEAKATYERLVQEFPASLYSPEARRRADFLGSAS